jgi:hypothetical protein
VDNRRWQWHTAPTLKENSVTYLQTLLAGMAGTIAMSIVMSLIHRSGWANADMIRAIGSCITRSRSDALKPGLAVHFASGLIFAFPYVMVLGAMRLNSLAATVGLGALIGFVHGFMMGFVLVAVVSDRHPVEQYHEAGFEVGAAHVLGHVAYGASVALMFKITGVDLGFRL